MGGAGASEGKQCGRKSTEEEEEVPRSNASTVFP